MLLFPFLLVVYVSTIVSRTGIELLSSAGGSMGISPADTGFVNADCNRKLALLVLQPMTPGGWRTHLPFLGETGSVSTEVFWAIDPENTTKRLLFARMLCPAASRKESNSEGQYNAVRWHHKLKQRLCTELISSRDPLLFWDNCLRFPLGSSASVVFASPGKNKFELMTRTPTLSRKDEKLKHSHTRKGVKHRMEAAFKYIEPDSNSMENIIWLSMCVAIFRGILEFGNLIWTWCDYGICGESES